jgi:D-glycero-D-manno-heptose 1,7-bisphosphate phosphatase
VNRALFLDRDGVVNDLVYYPSHSEWESPRSVADLRMRPGVANALRDFTRNGWLVFLITNQPSYAKGKCPLADLEAVHARVLADLAREGATITDSYVCYHHPNAVVSGFGACECRKPSPFFIRQAAAEHAIDLASSWVAGDQDTDIATGRAAGCRTALINYEHSAGKRGETHADLVCADLPDLGRKILHDKAEDRPLR